MAQAGRFQSWLAERYDLETGADRLRTATTAGRGPLVLHMLAALTIFFAGIELATGVLLGMYYQPTLGGAHDSVRFIVTAVEFGDLVRSLHAWGAHLLVGTLWSSLAVTLALGYHRKPHEFAWWLGVLLAVAVLGFAFTGELLPWTTRSLMSARVSSGGAGQVPFVGPALRRLMLGGDEPGAVAIVRILGFHAGVLPAVTTFLGLGLAAHALGLRRELLPPVGAPRAMPLYPHLVLRALAVWTLGFIVLLVLAVLAPPVLGAPASDLAGAAGLKPSWYLLFAHEALRVVPGRLLGVPGGTVVVCSGIVLVALALLLPTLDRRGGRLGQVFGLGLVVLLLGVTARALLT